VTNYLVIRERATLLIAKKQKPNARMEYLSPSLIEAWPVPAALLAFGKIMWMLRRAF
jgi:hypothetical protein